MSDLALFDFDGTITIRDSLIDFIRFTMGDARTLYTISVLSPVMIGCKLGFISNERAKQFLIARFHQRTHEYSLKRIDNIVRPKAMERIEWHQQQGHQVVIVSASMEDYLKPWCIRNGLDLIATRIEIKSGVITGKLRSRNCYGIEKVNRVHEAYNLGEYGCIYAYGDSRGDKEMLEIAHKGFYNYFR